MTAYTTARGANPRVGPGPGWHRELFCIEITVAVTAAQVDTNGNSIDLLYAPAGFTCVDSYLRASDLDTDGSPTLVIDVGDSGDDDRFHSAATVGQTGTAARGAVTGIMYRFSEATKLTALFDTGAATAAAGTITFGMIGFMDPDYRTAGEAATAV